MDEIKVLLETQPLFALFLTVALGYLVGEINIKGFSLGSGAVLFVGLAIGVQVDETLGLFAGSGTSTATLQAIIAALRNDNAAVGYSVAYPFGVAGPILCIHALNAWLKPKIEEPAAQQIETAEIELRNPAFFGVRFPELTAKLPAGVAIAAVRWKDQNRR
jgi:putative transport protein